MVKPEKVIVNVGMARCGTTSINKLFAEQFNRFATPTVTKELKFFLKDDAVETYSDHFKFTADQTLFESSPPYVHQGPDAFVRVLNRIVALRETGVEVHLLFNIRNLAKRAFSHYWHGIDSQYAAFGASWAARGKDHPRRYERFYGKSFANEVSGHKSADKFMPDVASFVDKSIVRLGVEHVHIMFTSTLDDCLPDFLNRMNPGVSHGPIDIPHTIGAREPTILLSDAEGRIRKFEDAPELNGVSVPPNSAFLFCRRIEDIVDGNHYDIKGLKLASKRWSRSIHKKDLRPLIADKVEAEAQAMAKIPDICFLADCKDALVADMGNIPDTLKMRQRNIKAADIAKLIQTVHSRKT